MRHLWRRVALLIAMCTVAGPGGAKPTINDLFPVELSLWSTDTIDGAGLWDVGVRAWDEVHSGSEAGEVRISVGPQVEVVRGPLHRTVHPGSGWRGPTDKMWVLRLKKKKDGPVEIRASLHLPGKAPGDSYDYEGVMTLEVSGSSVVTKENRAVVRVKSENGRRFRYGGTFPVAMDPDDPDVAVRVDTAPELLSKPVVEVKSASLIGRQVRFSVTVGKSGKVTWVHPRTIDLHWVSNDLWMRISDAVSRFQFRPARGEGHPVAENVEITVRLVPQQKG